MVCQNVNVNGRGRISVEVVPVETLPSVEENVTGLNGSRWWVLRSVRSRLSKLFCARTSKLDFGGLPKIGGKESTLREKFLLS